MADDQVVVAHPVTGELIDQLGAQPPEVLADALFALRERKRDLAKMQTALEDELRRRVAIRERAVFVFGDYEVSARPRWRREWDADELEVALRELLDAGSVHAGELTGLIHHETKVDGREAERLINRLTGQARKTVERCFRWREDRARVEVARSAQLTPTER